METDTKIQKKPGVSIILPIYNGQNYLLEQVNSILDQEYKDWELIICNDASTDDSLKIALTLSDSHEQIKVVNNNLRQGVGKNFESGLIIAKADLIAMCDADDYWLPNKLNDQVNYLNCHNEIDLVYHDVFITDSKLKIQNNSSFRKRLKGNLLSLHHLNVQKDDLSTLIKGNHITGPTIMFRSNLIKKIVPFQEKFSQDAWVVLVAAAFGKIAYIDKQLIKYRQHETNATGSKIRGYSFYISNFFSKGFGSKMLLDFTYYSQCLIELRNRLPSNKLNEFAIINIKIQTLKNISLLLESKSLKLYFYNSFNTVMHIVKYKLYNQMGTLLYFSLYLANPFKS